MKKIILLTLVAFTLFIQCSREKDNNDETLGALALVAASGESAKTESGNTENTEGSETTSGSKTVTLTESYLYYGQTDPATPFAKNAGDSIVFVAGDNFSSVSLSIYNAGGYVANCSGSAGQIVQCSDAGAIFTVDGGVNSPNITLRTIPADNYMFIFYNSSSNQLNNHKYTIDGKSLNLTEYYFYSGSIDFTLETGKKIQFTTDSSVASLALSINTDGYETSQGVYDYCFVSVSSPTSCLGNSSFGGSNTIGMFVPDSSVVSPNFTLTVPESRTYTFKFFTMPSSSRFSSLSYTGSIIE